MPIALTQKLWQNTSYLQLGGLINWFYVVITIFAQHLNICSPKLGNDGAFAPAWLHVRQQLVMILILLLQLETCRQLTQARRQDLAAGGTKNQKEGP